MHLPTYPWTFMTFFFWVNTFDYCLFISTVLDFLFLFHIQIFVLFTYETKVAGVDGALGWNVIQDDVAAAVGFGN